MYSGTTLRPMRPFDAWFGAHQKIDRVARRQLMRCLPAASYFPRSADIIKFEGLDGPDGIKVKSPAKDEPWHYMDPTDLTDVQIVEVIENHFQALATGLRNRDQARSAFEAAWLAHAIVDGLTPAHQYPYEAELSKLRGGAGNETRTSPKDKLIMPGDNLPKQLHNNWKMWGDGGLISTHYAFEWGVSAIIAPLRLGRSLPSEGELEQVKTEGLAAVFLSRANEIASLGMYEAFYRSGWTPALAKQVRQVLAPMIINTVTLAWYAAAVDENVPAKSKRKSKKA